MEDLLAILDTHGLSAALLAMTYAFVRRGAAQAGSLAEEWRRLSKAAADIAEAEAQRRRGGD